MRRRAVTLLVVLLVALSGCSLPTGDFVSTDTPADSDGDADDTPTPSPSPTPEAEYPAGYAGSGVEDVDAAVDGHRSALADADGFQLVYSAAVEGGGPSSLLTYDQRVQPDEERALLRVNVTSGEASGFYAQYYADDTMYVQSRRPNQQETSYSNVSQEFQVEQFIGAEAFVRPILENVTFESSQVVTRDGRRVIEFDDARLGEDGSLPTGRLQSGNVSEFSATMAVDPDGYVRAIEYRATVLQDGSERQLSVTFRVTDVGETTVERPEWVDEA